MGSFQVWGSRGGSGGGEPSHAAVNMLTPCNARMASTKPASWPHSTRRGLSHAGNYCLPPTTPGIFSTLCHYQVHYLCCKVEKLKNDQSSSYCFTFGRYHSLNNDSHHSSNMEITKLAEDFLESV